MLYVSKGKRLTGMGEAPIGRGDSVEVCKRRLGHVDSWQST